MLPRPLGPIADELEPLELLDDEEEEEPEGVLPVVVVLPKRLVAAVNADDAFEAELLTGELEAAELVELELEDGVEDVVLALALDEESRPWSLRLPLKFGVTSDT